MFMITSEELDRELLTGKSGAEDGPDLITNKAAMAISTSAPATIGLFTCVFLFQEQTLK